MKPMKRQRLDKVFVHLQRRPKVYGMDRKYNSSDLINDPVDVFVWNRIIDLVSFYTENQTSLAILCRGRICEVLPVLLSVVCLTYTKRSTVRHIQNQAVGLWFWPPCTNEVYSGCQFFIAKTKGK